MIFFCFISEPTDINYGSDYGTYSAEDDFANFQAEQQAYHSRYQPEQTHQQAKTALRDFVSKQANLHTRKKTDQCVSRFRNWLRDTHEITTQLEFIPADDLDTYLGAWLLAIRKQDGSDYEPDSLTSFHRGIARFLKAQGYEHCILKDDKFSTSRSVLAAKRKQLKSKGLGNKPNHAEPIPDDMVETLWKKGILGMHNAISLLNTVWFLNTELLGLRGSHKNRQMMWGDFEVEKRTTGDSVETVILWTERMSKTRPDAQEVRAYPPVLYPNYEMPERCPVRAYFLYKSQRPPSMLQDDAPFYLAVNHNLNPKQYIFEGGQPTLWDKFWYKAGPLGPTELGKMMKKMCKMAQISGGKFTNHSLRKRSITTLLHEGIEPNKIAQFSGHKSLASINNYAVVSREQQREMSHILQPTGPNKRQRVRQQLTIPHTETSDSTAIIPSQCIPSNETQQHDQLIADPGAPVLQPPPTRPAIHASQSNVVKTVQMHTKTGPSISGMFAGANIYGSTFHVRFHKKTTRIASHLLSAVRTPNKPRNYDLVTPSGEKKACAP